MIAGKKILVGISGGIAAYKTPILIRLLIKAGAEVKVVVTPNALEFVTRVTLETLSKHKIYDQVFGSVNDYSTEHVALTDWADAFVIAPATANIIGKYASGIADDALSTSLLAFNKAVFIAPAMNCKMWNNFAVQKNMEYLRLQGVHVIGPASGDLACGYEGAGRMDEPEVICRALHDFFVQSQSLKGIKAMVTAGPTYEAIDPVRFIGNHSSGLMGFCIAEELASRGADVTLIAGPTSLKTNHIGIKRIDIVSAQDMYDACINHFSESKLCVMSAAVADYKPAVVAQEKIKKKCSEFALELTPTQDVLKKLGEIKQHHQFLVGFALETENELAHAQNKLKRKNLDMIVLNSLKTPGAGFKVTTNCITILKPHAEPVNFDLKSKQEVAKDLVNEIEKQIIKE
jgi:phosphopantothenoylcysteine decarboxylase / phosphopantothenate---cysteine ligase